MKFTITRNDFLKSLQRVNGIVDTRGTMPILSNLLIETTSSDTITISATDLKLSFKGEIHANIESVGQASINAKKLFDIIKEAPSDDIIFETDENSWASIICGSSNFKIPGLPADEFPKIPEYEETNLITIDSAALQDMIRKVIFSVLPDDTRPALTGVFLKFSGNKVIMASTDGHRLAHTEMENIKGEIIDSEVEVIIPKKALAEILKIESSDSLINFCAVDNHAVFKQKGSILISRLIDEKFPDYIGGIPKDHDKKIILLKENLQHALRRVSILADEKSKMVKFSARTNSLELVSDSTGYGEAREVVPAAYEGDDVTVALNASYVLDVISILSDEIHIQITSPECGVLVGCPKNLNYKYIIMPMRVKSKNG